MIKFGSEPFLIEEVEEEQSPKFPIARFELDQPDNSYCANTQTSFREIVQE